MPIVSHPANQNYRDNFDEVFGKRTPRVCELCIFKDNGCEPDGEDECDGFNYNQTVLEIAG